GPQRGALGRGGGGPLARAQRGRRRAARLPRRPGGRGLGPGEARLGPRGPPTAGRRRRSRGGSPNGSPSSRAPLDRSPLRRVSARGVPARPREPSMSFPTLTLLIALPALTAVFLRDSERKRLESARVRGIAAGALTLTLLLALAVVFGSDQGSGPPAVEFVGGWAGLRAGPRLAVDAIVLPLLPVTVALAMAGILGTARRESTARHARAVLATCSGTLLLQCAADLDTFVVGWFASLLPSWFHARANALEDPRERGPLRILTVYLGLASLPLSLAAISLHVTSASGAELGSVVLHAQRSVTLAPRTQEWILLLLGVTALARKGMVPLHSWVPHLAERGSVALTTQLLGAHAGVLLLLRVAIPLLPDASRSVMALITGAAVVSASYGALMALG